MSRGMETTHPWRGAPGSFTGAPNDGIKPIDNVIKASNTLYGMTVYGGASVPSPDNPSVTGNGSIFSVPLPD